MVILWTRVDVYFVNLYSIARHPSFFSEPLRNPGSKAISKSPVGLRGLGRLLQL